MAEPIETSDVIEEGLDDFTFDAPSTTVMVEEVPEALPSEPVIERGVEPTTAPTVPSLEEVVDNSSLTPRERILMERLEQLTERTLNMGPPTASSVETPAVVPAVEHNFLEGVDLDEAFSTPENFNKVLQVVYAKALEDARANISAHIMSTLPEIVTQRVTQHVSMQERVSTFYADNPDLAEVKRTVAGVANEIATENPQLTLDAVFAEAASRTRRILHLPTTPIAAKSQGRRPAFAGQRSPGAQRAVETEVRTLSDEIEDLMRR
jgi:hypothetical protein